MANHRKQPRSPKLPAGWSSETLDDGSLLVRPRRFGTWPLRFGIGVFILAWNVVVWLSALEVLRQIREGRLPPDQNGWSIAALLLPFLVAGGFFLYVCTHLVCLRTTWRLARNLLEVRHSLFGFSWRRQYVDADLEILGGYVFGGNRIHNSWQLYVSSKERSRLLSRGFHPGEQETLGRFVSHYTGWRLTIA